jgi:extracellular elastinolytic metalloproteinase
MRLHPTTLLALLGLAGYTLAHDASISRRKTMGFGPVHPHAKFHTSPASFVKASLYTSDPYEIATSFVTELLQDQLSADNDFTLRKDSYTDRATGITHVYFRQRINGLEVADGDINVNVKGATIISYGDSVSLVVTRVASTSLRRRLIYHPSSTVAMHHASPSWGSQ